VLEKTQNIGKISQVMIFALGFISAASHRNLHL